MGTEAVKNGSVPGSLIAREYSSAEGEPYYPVPNPENTALYERYRALAEQEKHVCFVGRLASYKYFNMDQAILNALEIFDSMKVQANFSQREDRRTLDQGMVQSDGWWQTVDVGELRQRRC